MKYRDHNVVLISFDALQAAHVGCLGYERDVTPHLDLFAGQSFAFRHNYSVASWTVPSSMTWFTGVYPSEHGLTNKFAVYSATEKRPARLVELAPNIVTLAQVLKQNGYETGGFTGNAGVSGEFGFSQGFDTYYHESHKFGSFDKSVPEALKWLKDHKKQKFFVFLHGYDCHGQFSPVGGYDYRFVDRKYDGKYRGTQQEQELLREEGLERGHIELRDADVQFWRAIYDEKIQRADEKFGRFLLEFKALGLLDKTLFIITSDHGTEFYEHRRLDHGFSLYDEQLRVPLVIRLPGQKSGKLISGRTSSISLMPTILDLLDIPIDDALKQQMRGTSLTTTLQGEHVPGDAFSETNYRAYTYKRSIITSEGWKLIVTLENNERELYQLDQDPAEANSLVTQEPARAEDLHRRLFEHFKSIGHDLTTVRWQPGLNPVYDSQGK
jgi:arylsulfatase A-like enzyme